MRVKTIRKHNNSFPPSFIKNLGRKYELPEREAKNLITAGLVEADKPDEAVSQD